MRANTGASLLELVVVLAVLAVVAFVVARPSPLADVARHVADGLRRDRLHAIATSSASTCWWGTSFAGGPVALAAPPRGLRFTPDGLPRTCDGGGVGNATILLEHRGRHAAVIVSSLGRVRWELR